MLDVVESAVIPVPPANETPGIADRIKGWLPKPIRF
jgi:hypothetical protein